MENIQPVLNWFTDRGGKIIKSGSTSDHELVVNNSREKLTKCSDHFAEIGACSISDELYDYVVNNGPEPASWAEADNDEDVFLPGEIDRSALIEIAWRGLQIFLGEIFFENNTSTVSIQFLLDHGRNDDDDDTSMKNAIGGLEPLLPEGAEFEISHSMGTDIFLLCELSAEDLKPDKLDRILTTLTKFAEFAVTKVSILHLAPELKLKSSLN